MISPQRLKKAKIQGYSTYKAVKGNCNLTMNPYGRWNALANKWNEGWNNARRESIQLKQVHKFLERCYETT
jgi:hypothetical protein